MKSAKIPYLIILMLFSTYVSKDIYMATNGNDETGTGIIENPYLSLMKCQDSASAGDTVYIKGGTYNNFDIAYSDKTYNYIHYFNKSYITYKAYGSEPAIFDFEFDPKFTILDGVKRQRVAGFMVKEGTENVTFDNFSCTRVPTLSSEEIIAANVGKTVSQSECFQSRGKNIRFNRMKAYSNYAIGFFFTGKKSYNIAYRCDAYNNTGVDSGSKGNADGFGAHGLGAEFIECRAWDNSDDNYDCISSYGRNIFDRCWAFRINYRDADVQDGNGLKVGGWGKDADAYLDYGPYSGDNPPVHVVKNCLATKNKAYGFYTNHQPGQAAIWIKNRAYNNKANFDMTEGNENWEVDSSGKVKDTCGTREMLYYNFAYKYKSNIKDTYNCSMYGTEGNLFDANLADVNNSFNTWNFRNITLTDKDFLSLDHTELARERGPDGSLPEINFLKLNPNGPNYALLKAIEDEGEKYDILNNLTIINIKESYYDSDLNQYMPCSYKDDKCIECSSDNGIFYCTKCFEGYATKYGTGNDNICVDKTTLEGDKTFFTNDSGLNYYSCSLYNNINNCQECSTIDTCDTCEDGYNFYNDNTFCANQADVENHLYNYNSLGILKLCSSMINGCYQCDSYSSCSLCDSDYYMLENNTCLSKTIVEQEENYFKHEINDVYISCLVITNCIKCISRTECTYCKEGYYVNNNLCEKIIETNENSVNDENNGSNGLSKGAIIGIIIGCLLIFFLILGLVYYFIRKKN